MRKFPGIRGRAPHHGQERRREAAERAAAWVELGPAGQLKALDSRLGAGVGAVKQRARIKRLLSAESGPKKGEKKPKEEKARARGKGKEAG